MSFVHTVDHKYSLALIDIFPTKEENLANLYVQFNQVKMFPMLGNLLCFSPKHVYSNKSCKKYFLIVKQKHVLSLKEVPV